MPEKTELERTKPMAPYNNEEDLIKSLRFSIKHSFPRLRYLLSHRRVGSTAAQYCSADFSVGLLIPGCGSIVFRVRTAQQAHFAQAFHEAGRDRKRRFLAESDEILTRLERSDPALYIIAFERGKTLLSWGKAKEAAGEFHKALALNPSFDQAWMALAVRIS